MSELTTEEKITAVLEKLHQESALGGIIHDGKPHAMSSHANDDSCVTEAKSALLALINEERLDELNRIDIYKNSAWYEIIGKRIEELQTLSQGGKNDE